LGTPKTWGNNEFGNFPVYELNLKAVTQMVKNESQHSEKTRAQQGFLQIVRGPIKLRLPRLSTSGRRTLRPMVACFPGATMLEKLDFKC